MRAKPTVALQYLVEFRNGQDYKAVEDPSGDVPVIGSGGPFATASDFLYDGESVLFGRKGTIDKPRHENGRFWTVDTMYYTILGPRVDGRWLYYWATTVPYGLYSTSTALPSMTSSVLGRLEVPAIPLAEQRRIADFLDWETAEIDAMDAELDRLVEVLRERRHTAMLRNLNSDTHVPIGLVAEVALGKMLQTSRRADGDSLRPYMRAAHVQPDGFLDLGVEPKEMWFSESEVASLDLRAGDVVVVEGGVGGFGRAAYVNHDIAGWGFQNSIVRVRAGDPVVGRFLTHALVAARNEGLIALECSTSTMPHFTAEKVGRFRVPWHTHGDLEALVNAIDAETARIDEMIADANRLKELLAERRSTLITEVVTGVKEVPA